MPKPLRVLFVCIGNSCRSQLAEAIASHTASDVMVPSSAGLAPLGRIESSTVRVLAQRGIPCQGQFSKDLHDDSLEYPFDLIVNMTGRSGRSIFPGQLQEDWDVEDPFGNDMASYSRICDDIEARIAKLASRLRAGRPAES